MRTDRVLTVPMHVRPPRRGTVRTEEEWEADHMDSNFCVVVNDGASGVVIDGEVGQTNLLKWLNHSCDPCAEMRFAWAAGCWHAVLYTICDVLPVRADGVRQWLYIVNPSVCPCLRPAARCFAVRYVWLRAQGTEITFDYALVTEDAEDPALSQPCLCGAAVCRGTLFELREW